MCILERLIEVQVFIQTHPEIDTFEILSILDQIMDLSFWLNQSCREKLPVLLSKLPWPSG